MVLLDQKAAAEYIGNSPKTLERWRVRGGGPPYIKAGGLVRYSADDLDAWLLARRRVSTSDPGESISRRGS